MRRAVLLSGIALVLAASGCRSGSGNASTLASTSTSGAAASSSVPAAAPTTTAPPPGPRSATGAVGGAADDRIGPPGGGKPARVPLAEGQCFNDVLDSSKDPPVHSLQVIDCGQLHDAEVFAVMALPEPAGAPYPGDQATERRGNQLCLARFTAYIGVDYSRSALRLSVARPAESTWPTGDRTVVCAVYDGGLKPLAGSMRSTGR